MSDAQKSGILGPILVAATMSLFVVLVRLYGEVNSWTPKIFSTEGGGGGSWLGITWLVPLVGFWFGRRLAKNGSRPASTGGAIAWIVAGMLLTGGLAYACFGTELIAPTGDWRTKGMIAFPGAAVCGLAALRAWPKSYLALAAYGALARIPVLVAQFSAEHYGWHTHFNSGGKGGPTDHDTVILMLTLAESLLWPFAFTTLVGGIFAALGAATVRRH